MTKKKSDKQMLLKAVQRPNKGLKLPRVKITLRRGFSRPPPATARG